MQILHQFITAPHTCEYLLDRQARTEYQVVAQISPEEYEQRMNEGWRKFGHWLFHPVCTACCECRPIRICAADFVPDRSQRRALRRNADLTIRLGPPIVDDLRLDLYRRYHDAQSVRKGWPSGERDDQEYASNFVYNPIPAVEITVWEGEVLRAVVLTDVTPNIVSGVYHYHDPDCRDRGIGTFAMLQTLALARRLGRRWAYFGFYVAGCASMTYKARFHPCEILTAEGTWESWG